MQSWIISIKKVLFVLLNHSFTLRQKVTENKNFFSYFSSFHIYFQICKTNQYIGVSGLTFGALRILVSGLNFSFQRWQIIRGAIVLLKYDEEYAVMQLPYDQLSGCYWTMFNCPMTSWPFTEFSNPKMQCNGKSEKTER